jgi:hypothetical protein
VPLKFQSALAVIGISASDASNSLFIFYFYPQGCFKIQRCKQMAVLGYFYFWQYLQILAKPSL